MAITQLAKAAQEKWGPAFNAEFHGSALDEILYLPVIWGQDKMDTHTRFLASLAILLGCQSLNEYRSQLPAALNMGVTPAEAKEIVFQAVVYLGIGSVYPFLAVTKEILRGVRQAQPVHGWADDRGLRDCGIQPGLDDRQREMIVFAFSQPRAAVSPS